MQSRRALVSIISYICINGSNSLLLHFYWTCAQFISVHNDVIKSIFGAWSSPFFFNCIRCKQVMTAYTVPQNLPHMTIILMNLSFVALLILF